MCSGIRNTYLVAVFGVYLFAVAPSFAAVLPGPVLETEWLAKHKNEVVILDIRKDIKSFTTKPYYKKDKKSGKRKLIRVGGHIPGAVLVNYKQVRAKQKIAGKKLSGMLPQRKDFEALMQSVGLNKNSIIVITSKGESNGDMTMATRLYWTLKYFGEKNIAILNGGTAQWLIDKREISYKPQPRHAGNWQAETEDKSILASSDDVAKATGQATVQLLDTRAVSLYLGTWKKSYVYANGHITGAKNYPNELITLPQLPARFIDRKQTQSMMAALGIDANKPSITYCNSGHLASGSWFLLHEVLGNNNVRLYDGSMQQWTLEKRATVSATN